MGGVRAEGSGWWRSGVIYQVYPRSFQDDSGDGVGDLRGLRRRLDAIAALGVDALWVSPFYRSPMRDFGYDVEDHLAVDPLFGDLADAEGLIEEAHARGLRVLIDLVLSHTSSAHPWFAQSRLAAHTPYRDYYVWADPNPDGSPPNNWLSVFGGSAWSWEARRRQYYLHNFLSEQPDLNLHCAAVQEELLSVAARWLARGVDGFRLDTVNFYFHDPQLRSNPPAAVRDGLSTPDANPYGYQEHLYDKNRPETLPFLERLRALADRHGAVLLGELGEAPRRALELLAEYTRPGRLHLCYTFDLLGLDLRGGAAGGEEVAGALRRHEAAGAAGACWALSNHDVCRAATRLCPPGATPSQTAPLALALLLSLRGAPCLYQGEELGLPEAEVPYELLVDPYGREFWPTYKGRDGCRTPYPWTPEPGAGFSRGAGGAAGGAAPWLPIPEEHRALARSAQEGSPKSALSLTRRLLSRRSSSPALRDGALRVLCAEGGLLVYARGEGAGRAVCLFNLSASPAPLPSPLAAELAGRRWQEAGCGEGGERGGEEGAALFQERGGARWAPPMAWGWSLGSPDGGGAHRRRS